MVYTSIEPDFLFLWLRLWGRKISLRSDNPRLDYGVDFTIFNIQNFSAGLSKRYARFCQSRENLPVSGVEFILGVQQIFHLFCPIHRFEFIPKRDLTVDCIDLL